MEMEKTDTELSLLEGIYSAEKRMNEVRQRDLARISGLSLGMTNVILKRFAQKGWIVVKKINNRNLRYAITPEGVNEIARRSFRYFRRTIRNVSFYKDLIEELLMGKKREGYSGVLLLGVSDLEFLIEYISEKHGILFMKSFEIENAKKLRLTGKYLYVFAESIQDSETPGKDEVYLSSVFSGPAHETNVCYAD
jgi:DNA-binding MarR family transcriptional regulator